MELWHGCCPIHDRITPEDIENARKAHPEAVIMVHPECKVEVTALADHALSTGAMLKFVKESDAAEFVAGTEIGILHRMKKENPDKKFYPLDCNPVCEDMKKITLEKIAAVLRDLSGKVELPAGIIEKSSCLPESSKKRNSPSKRCWNYPNDSFIFALHFSDNSFLRYHPAENGFKV